MKKFLWSFLILILCGLAGFHILSAWRGFYPYQPQLSPEGFLRAIRLDSSNPDPFYRLGVFHQWEIHHINLKKSLQYLGEAIKRNPLEQEYWLSVARVLQRMGEKTTSEKALEKAIRVFPTAYQGRWTAGNLFLQGGEDEKALPHFSYILAHYPNQSNLVYDVWEKAIKNPEYLLEKLVPQDSFGLTRYLSYLYEVGDQETVKKVWKKRESIGYKADRPEVIRHVDFLISRGDFTTAHRVFVAKLREENLPTPSDKNLIVNGGFEEEKILEGGFDWKIGNLPGAVISFDRAEAFEGKNSLKIFFNGKENADFHHVYQYLALKPAQDYLLRAQVKTKGITTQNGIKLEVAGIGSTFRGVSESLIGDNNWKELSISFRTPHHLKGGMVRLRRERTDKFDRFISGTVWVDNVQLSEKKSH
jgi:hypothetical protein